MLSIPGFRQLQRQMEQALPRRRRLGHPTRADVGLKRLVEQPGRRQSGIAGLAEGHKLVLGDAAPQMLVQPPVVLHGHAWHRATALVWGVVVSRPDHDCGGQAEKLATRGVERVGTAAGEVAAGGANVRVEQRVAAKDIVCDGSVSDPVSI